LIVIREFHIAHAVKSALRFGLVASRRVFVGATVAVWPSLPYFVSIFSVRHSLVISGMAVAMQNSFSRLNFLVNAAWPPRSYPLWKR